MAFGLPNQDGLLASVRVGRSYALLIRIATPQFSNGSELADADTKTGQMCARPAIARPTLWHSSRDGLLTLRVQLDRRKGGWSSGVQGER
jgi:hypothetical protein